MRFVCELAAPFIANAAVEGRPVSGLLQGHASSCLRCQARHAAMTRTARELTAMGDVLVHAPADLEWRVMSSLEGDLALARTWRAPVALIAAALSAAAALVFWRVRPRSS